MKNDPVRVAVIIPFYQREKGILQRAITSVLAQSLLPGVELQIIVVDDASPVSATDELAMVHVPPPHGLRIVRQANGGPGAARNTALDLLDPAITQFVAFLDSDDEWQPYHISTALSALDQGHDFYFCDHIRFDSARSWLERSAIFNAWQNGTRRPVPERLTGYHDIFSLPARAAFDACIEEYLSQTSTVVYRFDRHPAIRFDTDLRSAGEDHLFWLTLLQKCASIAFSTHKNVACGRGINLYFSVLDWEKPDAAARHGYLLVYRLKIRRLRLNPTQAARIDAQISEDGQTYAYLLARHAARGRMPDWAVLSRIFKTSSRHVLALPLRLLPMLSKRERERIAGLR